MKKLFAITLFFALAVVGFSEETQVLKGFHEYTLENSLKVFVLEDFSSAPIRIELTVKAGFSSQTPKTAGFFPLYQRLFANSGQTYSAITKGVSIEEIEKVWLLSDIQSECNADCSRFVVTTTPMQAEKILEQFSFCLFSPIFDDKSLKNEFESLKTSVMKNAFSTAGFINSSIDSRVFAENPWTQDSGIYPSLFTNTPLEEVRTILSSIGKNYYTSENVALFISGAITSEQALNFVKKYFLKQSLPSAKTLSDSYVKIQKSTQKKYVLHDSLFTQDMTQIVVQYTTLPLRETDVASTVLSLQNSPLKKTLLENSSLSIRAEEYINVAAAHKNGNSRVIIQSLLEKNKTSPAIQSENFLQIVKNSIEKYSEDDFDFAKKLLISEYKTLFKNSIAFMDLLSQFWAINDVSKMHTENVSTELLEQPSIILQTDVQKMTENYKNEEPFVFVLLNTFNYKKYEKDFKKLGYEEVSTKNGSWYSQKLYEQLKKQISHKPDDFNANDDDDCDTTDTTKNLKELNFWEISSKNFITANEAQFFSFRLSNDIPVIAKQNEKATTALISLAISGGKLSSASSEYGITEVMTNALAKNIQKEVFLEISNKKIFGTPEVLAETKMSDSIITVECLTEDVLECLKCICNAIIYGKIKPAEADGIIYNTRSNHRVLQGSTEYQLFAEAIKLLYSKTDYPFVYNTNAEILKNTQYTQILASYPSFLDAAKYSFVLTGNIPAKDELKALLEDNFAVLKNQTAVKNRLYKEFPRPNFKQFYPEIAPTLLEENSNSITTSTQSATINQTPLTELPQSHFCAEKKVQLSHQFFTDISADKAGSRPEILIPTTEFLDPVQYWICSPEQDSYDFFIFNALINELEERLENSLKSFQETQNVKLRVIPASAEIQAAIITFFNVKQTQKIDEIFVDVVQKSLDPTQESSVVDSIKSKWILKNLSKTQTNRETALLMRESLVQGEIKNLKGTKIEKIDSIQNSMLLSISNKNSDTPDTSILAAKRYLQEYQALMNLTPNDFLRVAKKYLIEQKPLKLYSADSK